MNLVKWNPLNEMQTLRNQIDRMFNEPFFPTGWFDSGAMLERWNPAVDVFEEDNAYVVKAELPGVDKKDLTVDFKDGILTIKGERSADNEVNENRYFRRERVYGNFQRSFALPKGTDAETIGAEYKDGVLRVTIPKAEEVKPKQITVH